jgi:hypothetical protein
MRSNTDHDQTRFEQDEYGNLYPIDADSRYGITLEDLWEEDEG